MKKETEYKENENGSFTVKETITTTPDDGVVPESQIRPEAMSGETRGKAHVGYSTTRTYSTNDPRVTRIVVLVFCILFVLVAVMAFNFGQWGFSILFIAAAVFIFVKGNKQIDAIAQKLKGQGKDVEIDSVEELKEVASSVSDEFKTGFKESAQGTFTEEHIKKLIKWTLPIYCVLGVLMYVLLSAVAGKVIGRRVFLIFVVGAILFYGLLLMLAKVFKKR